MELWIAPGRQPGDRLPGQRKLMALSAVGSVFLHGAAMALVLTYASSPVKAPPMVIIDLIPESPPPDAPILEEPTVVEPSPPPIRPPPIPLPLPPPMPPPPTLLDILPVESPPPVPVTAPKPPSKPLPKLQPKAEKPPSSPPTPQPVPAAPAPAPRAAPSDGDALTPYIGALRQAIMRHRAYPSQSMRRGEEGTIIVRIVVTADGALGAVSAPAGGPVRLVEAAIQAVRDAAPFPPPPAALGGRVVEVPVTFRLQ